MLPGHPEHLRGFAYVGMYRYSLRFCTADRREVFVADGPVSLALTQIVRAACEQAIAVITYCFMPDHLHLLVAGENEASDCKRFILRAKQYSGYYYRQAYDSRLWQRYGYERVLRDDEPTEIVARYILENPLRAGLVQNVQEYPYLGSMVYTLAELRESLIKL